LFPCKRWLAKDEEDGAIERELVAEKVLDEVVRKDGTIKKKELQRRNTLSCNYNIFCCRRLLMLFSKRVDMRCQNTEGGISWGSPSEIQGSPDGVWGELDHRS